MNPISLIEAESGIENSSKELYRLYYEMANFAMATSEKALEERLDPKKQKKEELLSHLDIAKKVGSYVFAASCSITGSALLTQPIGPILLLSGALHALSTTDYVQNPLLKHSLAIATLLIGSSCLGGANTMLSESFWLNSLPQIAEKTNEIAQGILQIVTAKVERDTLSLRQKEVLAENRYQESLHLQEDAVSSLQTRKTQELDLAKSVSDVLSTYTSIMKKFSQIGGNNAV